MLQRIETHENDRVEWIDLLKGLGIVLVFLGHLGLSNQNIITYIFSFHMPLFFFLSGLFFKKEHISHGFRTFLKKKIQTRLIPYFSFGLLTYMIWLFRNLLKKYGAYHGSTPVSREVLKPLLGMLYGNGISGWLEHNILLWFLACLFTVEIIFYFILSMSRQNRFLLPLTLIIFSFVGYLDSLYSTIRLPFSFDVSLTAVVFYGIAFISREYVLDKKINPVLGLLLFATGLAAALLNLKVDMNANRYGNYFLFYLSSLSSIFAFVWFAKTIPRIRVVSYIGTNSLIFFLLQGVSFFGVNIVLTLFNIRMHPETLSLSYALFFTIVAISLLFPVSYFINAKIPQITGKSGTQRSQSGIVNAGLHRAK